MAVSESVRVYLGLGSNIDAHKHIISALEALRGRFHDVRLSPIYRTPAEGFEGDFFLNLVVCFETDLDVLALVKWLREVEMRNGRRREQPSDQEGKGSHTLDMDLLMYGELRGEHYSHELPRPDVYNRRFVWQPMAELIKGLNPISELEDDVRKRVLKLWEERPPLPQGFERTYIPHLE